MTYQEAIKITKVNKKSKFRIVPIEDLGIWETTLNSIVKEIDEAEVVKDIDVFGISKDLDQLSHDIMSVRL